MLFSYKQVSDDELLVFLQQLTHDIPYGDYFRVHEVFSFSNLASGVSFNKWTWVDWIMDLPWLVTAMKPITESKAKAASPAAGEAFVEHLGNVGFLTPVSKLPTLGHVALDGGSTRASTARSRASP